MDRNLVMTVLEQLRRRLIIIVIAVAAGSILSFYFVDPIRQMLLLPGRGWRLRLYFNSSEVFMANLRLAVAAGAVISLPVTLYQVAALIGAVNHHFKKKRYC